MLSTLSFIEEVSLTDWARTIKRSVLQEMLAITTRPGLLSFALGLPAPELFPTAELAQATARVLATEPRSLQYGPPFQPLKRHIVNLMAQRGVDCREEQIFLTAGAQQGMNLLTRLLLNPGGQVLIESLSYTGFQQVIDPYQPDILTVPADPETGMDVDAVEMMLMSGARPSFIYSVTDGHNPLGSSLSREKRVRLVELAREFQIPIMEDDAYGFLCYEESSTPPLRALDEQWVFYVGSFSKILAPSLRAGWIVAPESLIGKLSIVKEASDIDTATLNQRIVSAYLDADYLPDHLATLCREYRTRRDVMLSALREYFPIEARWAVPPSGLFIWVELPEEVDAAELLRIAVDEEQVAFIPGIAFCVGPDRQAANCMRLNFSNCALDRIREGIAKLAAALEKYRLDQFASTYLPSRNFD